MSKRDSIEYIRRVLKHAQGDNTYRAECAFRGLNATQMQEQHGQSGKTRQEILDGYRANDIRHDDAVDFFEGLLG